MLFIGQTAFYVKKTFTNNHTNVIPNKANVNVKSPQGTTYLLHLTKKKLSFKSRSNWARKSRVCTYNFRRILFQLVKYKGDILIENFLWAPKIKLLGQTKREVTIYGFFLSTIFSSYCKNECLWKENRL